MRGRLVAAVAIGLAPGAAGAAGLVRQAEARVQEKEKKSRWEYRIIRVSTMGKEAANGMTDRCNDLAAEGWEYVGPVVEGTYPAGPGGGTTGIDTVFLAFKRPK